MNHQLKVMKHTTWVLPLSIVEKPMKFMGRELTDWLVFYVVTGSGNRVGPRLLKGQCPPNIRDWGPFDSQELAVELKATLEKHIEAEWPRKKGRKRK